MAHVNSCTPLNCYTGHCVLPQWPLPYVSLNVEQMNEKIVHCTFIFPWFVACICECQLTAFSSCNRQNSVLKLISGAGNLQGLYAWGTWGPVWSRSQLAGGHCMGTDARAWGWWVGWPHTPGIGGANGKLGCLSEEVFDGCFLGT